MTLSGTDAGRTAAKLITVSGELDRNNAHLLIELVEIAVGALLQARDAAAGAGGRLTLRDAAPCVRYVLAVDGVEAPGTIRRPTGPLVVRPHSRTTAE